MVLFSFKISVFRAMIVAKIYKLNELFCRHLSSVLRVVKKGNHGILCHLPHLQKTSELNSCN